MRALAATCRRHGWQLVEVLEEARFSAEELERPRIREALRVLASAVTRRCSSPVGGYALTIVARGARAGLPGKEGS